MTRVVGVDAGGTKTVGLLADETGNVLRSARAGGANLVVHGELAVEKVLYQIFEDLRSDEPVAALCVGMAGVDGAAEREVLRQLLRRLGHRDRVRVENDALIALVAGAPEGIGIVVVAGTGSIAYGVDPSGAKARSGGWGYLLGDEGSAFWLGQAAIRLGIRAAEGRGPATSLYDRIRKKLQLATPGELVRWFYDQEQSRSRVARLAELVEEAAREGDDEAGRLLDQGAEHLSRAAQAVARQLTFPDGFPLVLAGGAFKACPSLAERMERRLGMPGARVVRLDEEPATGAVHLALGLL